MHRAICKGMDARGWMQGDGCKGMDARGWMQGDGCKGMDARQESKGHLKLEA